jgi:D-3-phosphoglycerate dehydrogenase / 2-oxoglutarate reductase
MLGNMQYTSGRSAGPTVHHKQPAAPLRSARVAFSNVSFGLRADASLVDASSSRCVAAHAASTERPHILVSEKLGQAGIHMLSENATVEEAFDLSPEDLCKKMAGADALIVRSATKVTSEVIEASKGRLKVVGRAGVGIDNVDLAAATENGVMVVNAPNANTVAAAEHGIALLCALSRNVAQADASVKAGKWERSKFVGVSLVGKTLAVLGFGKVGADVARRAKGLGMTVIAHDPYAPEEKARALNVKLVTFDEALKSADFISLHMPLTSGTKNILNKDAFAKCKKGVRIVNVARGGVIDEQDLLEAVESGQVAQAALDVFTSEPPEAGSKVVAHPNIVCTPHLGASTKEAQVRPACAALLPRCWRAERMLPSLPVMGSTAPATCCRDTAALLSVLPLCRITGHVLICGVACAGGRCDRGG